MTSFLVSGVIGGGVVKLERVHVICPACGHQVEAVAWDGRVKGYCAVARQSVDFLIETQPERKNPNYRTNPEYRAKLSAGMKKRWQDPEFRARQRVSQSATLKKRWQDPEFRARQSAGMKKRWQDPEYRARLSAAAKKRGQGPE